MKTLHLMTQRDQPFGSVRKCCELCGAMITDSTAYCEYESDFNDVLKNGHKGEKYKTCAGSTAQNTDM